ncbi:MAG: methyltransferase family protein [Pseudobdellovibrionaceae bacterium]
MKLIDFLNKFSKFLVVVTLFVPAVLLFRGNQVNDKLPLLILFYVIILERVWFSLFTTKEGKSQKKRTDDWSLVLVTYTYLGFLGALFYDFFFDIQRDLPLAVLGLFLIVLSYFIRNWSVSHLGEQWASHLEVADNVNRSIIRSGPYRHMRHPIYTAAFIEFIGMQFLFGGRHSLVFLFCVSIPSVIVRALYEEKICQVVFGLAYSKYMGDTTRFFPNIKTLYK